jgi:porin
MEFRSLTAYARLALLLGLLVLATAVNQSAAAQCVGLCNLSNEGCDGASCQEGDFSWMRLTRSPEESGIKFEGSLTQFYQGVASGGIEQKFRYGGHGDYDIDLDFGRICGLDGFTLELGSEHRFAETVNLATGSVVPVALQPNLPDPATNDLALTKVRFALELHDGFEIFCGKIDTLEEDSNAFADGNGGERFFNSAFNYYPVATRTVPFSTLGAGVNVIRDGERVFTLAVLDTKDTATTIGISELFDEGAVIFSQLRLPVTILGHLGHQAIGGSWSSASYASLAQDGRIDFPDIPIATKNGSWALFWSADQYLWQDPCDDTRGWGLFGRAGISDGNPNPIEWTLSFGVGGDSPLLGREEDRFGIGWYYVGISDQFIQLANVVDDGQGIELFYDIAMSQTFRFALNFQVVDPTITGVDTAVVPGIRGRIEF